MSAGQKIHLLSSSGGHLELLIAARGALEGRDLVWVTSESRRAIDLREGGEEVRWLPGWDRGSFGPARVLAGAWMALRDRPRLIVTSGAGMVVPYCVVAWLLGARIVFIETMARVDRPSMSGSVLSRIADRVIVQWPDLLKVYSKAALSRPLLLEGLRESPRAAGEGTLVAVGTHTAPFNRMLSLTDEAVTSGVLPAPVTAQTGSSTYEPDGFHAARWLTPADLATAFQSCRYIVCHAGSGMISGALRAGRRPLVVPRLQRHGEHVDDHQEVVANKLAELGLAVHIQGAISPVDLLEADKPLAMPNALRAAASMPQALTEALGELPPPRPPVRWAR